MGCRDVTRIRLDYVHEFRDRHGKLRRYFRRPGFKRVPLPGIPGSAEFMEAYQAALAGFSPGGTIGASRSKPGTVAALVAAYFASPGFLTLEPITQRAYRSILDKFRAEHGDKPVALLERRHISGMLAKKIDTPTAANHWLRMVRALMQFAIVEGLRKDDPTAGIKPIKYASEGFYTWTDEDIAAFEAKHPIGSKARLALTLLLCTGCRRGDVVTLGRQHIKNGYLTYTQHKNRNRKPVTLTIKVLPELQRVIDATPADHLTFVVNSFGRPFTIKGFGNWMRDRCREAGLPECTAHGLRKAVVRRMVEAGYTPHQIMSITGHTTLKEIERYARAYRQKLVAETAIHGLDREHPLANPDARLANPKPSA